MNEQYNWRIEFSMENKDHYQVFRPLEGKTMFGASADKHLNPLVHYIHVCKKN